MMPRWTSALPPMIVAARVYHHFGAGGVERRAAATRPGAECRRRATPAIIQSRRTISRMRSLMSFSASAEQQFVDAAVRADRVGLRPGARTVVAVRAWAASTATYTARSVRVAPNGGPRGDHVLPQPAQLRQRRGRARRSRTYRARTASGASPRPSRRRRRRSAVRAAPGRRRRTPRPVRGARWPARSGGR